MPFKLNCFVVLFETLYHGMHMSRKEAHCDFRPHRSRNLSRIDKKVDKLCLAKNTAKLKIYSYFGWGKTASFDDKHIEPLSLSRLVYL